MNKLLSKSGWAALAVTALSLAAHALRADVVETKDGSRIVGKLTKIDQGKVYLTTTYAGDLAIAQKDVTAITTDSPVAVRLASGTRIDGAINSPNGALQVAGADGTITTSVAKVAASWPVGATDPAIVALQRHWSYEASVDVNGTKGNKSQLGTAVGLDAKLTAPQDSLELYTGYNRQVTEGQKSADQFKAGLDYTNQFRDTTSWFLRDEGGFDRVQGILFYDTAAFGIGQDIFKSRNDTLTGRVGLAYRYTGYSHIGTPSVNSAAGDLELNHAFKSATWELVNKLAFVPAFSDFSNYIIVHDSFYQIPLSNPAWKLRIGLANNVNNKPPPGIKKVDTSYYTRLILDWGR